MLFSENLDCWAISLLTKQSDYSQSYEADSTVFYNITDLSAKIYYCSKKSLYHNMILIQRKQVDGL